MRRLPLLLAAAALTLLVAGCECSAGGDRCTVSGTVGCPCGDGEPCRDGLDCVEGLCTDPDGDFDGGGMRRDAGDPFVYRDAQEIPDVGPNPDAFFADDPPPMVCLEDGGMGPSPDPPGGTPDCPDDKNREGCRCDEIGATAPCWPGLRVNRNRGICRDGTTTCEAFDEFTGRWGPCNGYVLPVEGVELGPQACTCFSAGRWEIDNLSPCFITYTGAGGEQVYAVSTDPASGACPTPPSTPPPTPSWETWSDNRLTVDCEGRFELCYTIKAGDGDAPSDADCVLARVCTGELWYETRDTVQELPPLPSWTGSDPACARQFRDSGGYGEMSVLGLSVECDPISVDGGEYVFNRVTYCPLECATNPSAPGCEACMRGGSGMF